MTAQLEIAEIVEAPASPAPTIDFERIYTLEEFLNLQWSENDENNYELIEGKIVAEASKGVSAEHGEIIFKLGGFLASYLATNPIGRGYSEAPSTLGRPGPKPSWVVPDLAFVLAGRTSDKFRGPLTVAPDLAVEIWSPSDSTEIIHDKIEAYLNAGVRLIWSIYLLDRYVIVHNLDTPKRRLFDLDDELDGEGVLPGFKLAVKALFD